MPKATKKKQKYNEDSILEAIAAVQNGMTYKEASEKYGVPTTTIHDKKNDRSSLLKGRPGPRTSLSREEEKKFVDWILKMAKIGYGITRKEIPHHIKEILDKEERTIFKNNLPSSCWTYRFMSRWPVLSARLPENLGYQRTYIDEGNIKAWFRNVSKFLKDEHDIDAETFFVEENASRIYNLDESGFPLAGSSGKLKVITERGAKNVYKMAPDSREQITVLGCACADGNLQKPFVLFPGVRPKFNFDGVNPEDFDVGCTPNGWISSDSFFEWLANCFYPCIRDTVQFPIILFMDGHTSHINVAVSEFANSHGIIMFCFPPHASHILQPLDVAVYGPLKKYWNQSLNDFARQYKGLAMSRAHFFSVFNSAWLKAVNNPQNVKSGFRKTGILPLNPDAVDYSKIIVKEPTNNRANESSNVTNKEKIGMFRMAQCIERALPINIKTLFETRFQNDYDIEDQTDRGILYKVYRDTRRLIRDYQPNTTNDQDDMGQIAELQEDLSQLEQSEVQNTSNINCTVDLNGSRASTEDVPPLPMNVSLMNPQRNGESTPSKRCTTPSHSEISPIAGTSGVSDQPSARAMSFEKWKDSPFKNHFVIGKDVIITRKVTKTKPKTPAAVSGKDYLNFLQKKQDEKKKKEDEKEKRKKEREQKRNSNGSKRVITPDSEESEEEMVLESDDDIEADGDVCYACYGNEDWSIPEAWIGCSNQRCKRWFHKECLNDNVTSMNELELQNYNFYCKACEKRRNK